MSLEKIYFSWVSFYIPGEVFNKFRYEIVGVYNSVLSINDTNDLEVLIQFSFQTLCSFSDFTGRRSFIVLFNNCNMLIVNNVIT